MIYIMTGPVHSGKTSFLYHQTHIWKKDNLNVDGFLSIAKWEGHKRYGYDLYDLKNERMLPYIRKRGESGWPQIGPYYFIPSSLKEAQNIILRGKQSFLLVIDELGPLELKGKGLWLSLEKILFQKNTRFLLVVRETLLDEMIHKLHEKNRKVKEIFNFPPSPAITEKIWGK